MPSYILRNVPPELWDAVKARAEGEGLPLRHIILQLLRAYAEGHVHLTAADTQALLDYVHGGPKYLTAPATRADSRRTPRGAKTESPTQSPRK
jgi:hypothetical protein